MASRGPPSSATRSSSLPCRWSRCRWPLPPSIARWWRRRVIPSRVFLPFVVPAGFYCPPWAAITSHAICFVTLPVVARALGFASIARALVEAAATMGADERTVFRTVVVPLILPYLVSGYAFAFVLSLNEYIVAYMTVGFILETLPIKIFNALRYGYTPTMASVSIFFVRSEEHTSELQSLMRISYAVFCLKKKIKERNI